MLVFIRGSEHGWWLVGLPPDLGRNAFPFNLAITKAATELGLAFIPNWAIVVSVLALGGLLAGIAITGATELLRIDRAQVARLAMRDTFRPNGRLLRWLAPGVALAALALALPAFRPYGSLAILVLATAAPFLLLHDDVLSDPARNRAWRPNWPGWAPLALSVGFVIATAVVEGLQLLAFNAPWAGASALAMLAGGFALAATLSLGTAAWVDRLGPTALRERARRLLRWQALGAGLAWQARWFVLLAWLLAPLMALSATTIWILPQLEEYARPGKLPDAVLSLYPLARDAPMLATLPIVFVLSYSAGKLYRLLCPRG